MDDQNQKIMWQFIRGDLPVPEFEKWLYVNNDFESAAGKEFHLEVISTNFKVNPDVYALKEKLEKFMRQKMPLSCECAALPNLAVTDMGSEQENRIWETLEEVKAYGETRWWLALYQCKKCSQYWLVAQESHQYDIHCFKRLEKAEAEAEKIIQNNEWPKHFETLDELVAMSIRFLNWSSSAPLYSVEYMLRQRPDITHNEIASMLNVDENFVNEIYSKLAGSKKSWWKFWN